MGTTTPNFGLYKPAVGETGWGVVVDANWDTIDANLTNALPFAYLSGCQLTLNAGSPLTKIDLSKGQAQDVNNAGAMTLVAMTKDITASWVAGSNNGGLSPALTLAVSTWYHLFVIKRTDTNTVDAYFDTSVTAANIPTPYTLFRRVGSLKTDGAKNILPFVQDGDLFQWATPLGDINQNNPGTAAVTATMTVPTGVRVMWIGALLIINNNSTETSVLVSDLATTDTAPTAALCQARTGNIAGNQYSVTQLQVHTNTLAQVRYRLSASSAAMTVDLMTSGWLDARGRNG